MLTVAGCDSRAYCLGTFLGDYALFLVVAIVFAVVAVATGLLTDSYSETFKFKFPKDAATPPRLSRLGVSFLVFSQKTCT